MIINCKICNNTAHFAFEAKVLNKYDVKYFSCANCEYLFAETPYWLDEAYKRAINISDTGLLSRNIHLSKRVSVLTYFFLNRRGKYLDYSGGYGVFTRLMRDIGFDYFWNDPYCENIFARGFEYDITENTTFDMLTSFEVFEHLPDPLLEIEKMIALSDNIIFSTEVLPVAVPKPLEWWYYQFFHGQHVSFYSKRTLHLIARKYGKYFYSSSGVHLFTKKKLNTFLVMLCIKLTEFGLFLFVKSVMKNKVWDDYLKLKNVQQS